MKKKTMLSVYVYICMRCGRAGQIKMHKRIVNRSEVIAVRSSG